MGDNEGPDVSVDVTRESSGRRRTRVRRLLVLTTYPTRDASRRLRIEPLVEKFQQRGFSVYVHEIFSEKAFQLKNAGFWGRTYAGTIVLLGLMKRVMITLVWPRSDVLLVHREAFPFLTPIFERLSARKARVAVVDVDDAIHHDVTHGRDWRRYLRDPSGAKQYSDIFDLALCGNPELRDVYSGGRAKTMYAPTCPERHLARIPRERTRGGSDVVWIGSQSTLPSLLNILPEIKEALRTTGSTLLVIGGENALAIQDDQIITRRWSPDVELEALSNARIGIMPLPDTQWERGKSGYKAIMYLFSGLTAVVSPVGFNELLCQRYGAIACPDGSWANVLAKALDEWRPANLKRVQQIRSDFDSDRVAEESCQAIVAILDSVGKMQPIEKNSPGPKVRYRN